MSRIRKHWAAIVLACIAGALTALPPIVAEQWMGQTYQGVHPLVVDDQLAYEARARETLDGHPTLGNPYLLEDKDVPAVGFWLPDYLRAKASQVLFGDLHTGEVVFNVVLPFVAVLVTYAILFLITGSVLWSVVLTGYLNLGLFFLQYSRYPNPQLTSVFLFSFLAQLMALRTRRIGWIAAAILTTAALFYLYPFYWTYAVVLLVLGIFGSWLLARESGAHKTLSIIFVASVALGLPYLANTYAQTKLPFYRETLMRIGFIPTRFPSGITVVALAAVTGAFLAWAWHRRIVPRTSETVFVAAASLAGAVVMNQHVITGSNFQFTVHYTMPAVIMSVFALAYAGVRLVERAPEKWKDYRTIGKIALVAVLVIISISSVAKTVTRMATPQPSDIAAQRYAPVLRWLDANTATDAVVYADQTLAPYIPAYTRDNVYFSPWAGVAYLSQDEVNTRYLGAHYFDASFSTSTVIANENDVFGAYYVGRYQHAATENSLRRLLHLPPVTVARYPEDAIAALVAKKKQLQQGSFRAALGGYRVDYLVWDSTLHPEWKITRVPGLAAVYEANGIKVYAVSDKP